MRALLAELVNTIAEQHESEKELIIQAEALNIVVTAILMRLDDNVRAQLKNEINEAFASQHGGHPSFTDETHILQRAVEELFNFHRCPSPRKRRIEPGNQP
ncbi:sigma-S stabilization anti-adapter protein IraP (plasmid) [Leclercia adecarboxylata]|uniref:sigma-S stabilization anti-adapter protein IraP n=1 Tax=Leclercia adecarboxylata TaxID=83655 RepID=UPI00254D7BBE|nr:sigma-S stabilization anti-adapter protein IraP [Leclercia adecarboxylata]MDK4743875.1 sigma-S stabilization anti-adapter protein IraP [Leclercia adecarboxylata]